MGHNILSNSSFLWPLLLYSELVILSTAALQAIEIDKDRWTVRIAETSSAIANRPASQSRSTDILQDDGSSTY